MGEVDPIGMIEGRRRGSMTSCAKRFSGAMLQGWVVSQFDCNRRFIES